jgi:hypothetical protein
MHSDRQPIATKGATMSRKYFTTDDLSEGDLVTYCESTYMVTRLAEDWGSDLDDEIELTDPHGGTFTLTYRKFTKAEPTEGDHDEWNDEMQAAAKTRAYLADQGF